MNWYRSTRESVYAPRSGTVIGFPALDDVADGREDAQGMRVQPGDVVVRLENAELDYELTTLLGEQATVDQQLETIAVSMGQSGRSRDTESRDRYDELTAQAAELRSQTSIACTPDSVGQRRAGETLGQIKHCRSDPDVGRCQCVDAATRAARGSVARSRGCRRALGDRSLCSRSSYRIYKAGGKREFRSAFHLVFPCGRTPQREYTASIKSIAMSTEVYPEYGSAVRVIGKIDGPATLDGPGKLDTLRPGTTIIAKVDCGKKPLAYVMLYDLVHTIRMWMLF